MTTRSVLLIAIGPFLLALTTSVEAGLSSQQAYSLFSQANEAFRQANSMAGDPQAEKLYEKAILSYEKIIHDSQIVNAKLYYNLGNAYFLKGDLGKAMLNYRRAERLDSSDENIRKNLAFARSKRLDVVEPKTERRILQTLFFWHYDISLKARFVLACVFFAVACVTLTVIVWSGRSAAATTAMAVGGILMLCFSISTAWEAHSRAREVCGVITAKEVVAHQADWENSPPSFKEPLHAGTEFDLIEQRHGWLHIRLADGSDGWISNDWAELI